MGNCLVEKLKAVVDNQNLPHFACLDVYQKIYISGSNQKYVTAVAREETPGTTIEILDGPGIITSAPSPGEKLSDTKALCPAANNGSGAVYFSELGVYKFRYKNYYYLEYLKFFIPTTDGLHSLDDERLQFMKNSLYFFVPDGSSSVPTSTTLTGSINSFNGFTTLLNLNLLGFQTVNGNLKDMLDAMYANGRVSDILMFDVRNTGVDYSTMPYVSGLSKANGTITFSSSGWTQTA